MISQAKPKPKETIFSHGSNCSDYFLCPQGPALSPALCTWGSSWMYTSAMQSDGDPSVDFSPKIDHMIPDQKNSSNLMTSGSWNDILKIMNKLTEKIIKKTYQSHIETTLIQ